MLGFEEQKVCSGIADLYGDQFVYILSHSNLTNSEICGLVISPSCGATYDYPNGQKWMIPLLPLNATAERLLANLENTTKTMATSHSTSITNVSTILHLSDIHLDLYYQMNTFASCNEPLCCRAESTKSPQSFSAGYWGSFGNCDAALVTIQSLINTIALDYSDEYKYLLFTGDYIAHDVWNTTKNEIIATTRKLNGMFRQSIPKNKIVIPVIGNHEGYPVNQ